MARETAANAELNSFTRNKDVRFNRDDLYEQRVVRRAKGALDMALLPRKNTPGQGMYT